MKGMQSQSGGDLSLYVVAWEFSQLCQLLNLECFTCFVRMIQSHCSTYVFGVTTPYHIPFQNKVMVKKSDHVKARIPYG